MKLRLCPTLPGECFSRLAHTNEPTYSLSTVAGQTATVFPELLSLVQHCQQSIVLPIGLGPDYIRHTSAMRYARTCSGVKSVATCTGTRSNPRLVAAFQRV